jgi:glycosyltransferase involved in cell wall biosynthesis
MSEVSRDTPLISVAIPTRNRADLLEACLSSLVDQTLSPELFEVVVVDDGSTDSTAEVCERLSEVLPLTYQRLARSGIAAAKNAGLFASRGWIVLFFDDDDIAHAELLRAHVEAHRQWSDPRIAILGYTTWHPSLKVTPVMRYATEIGQNLFSYPSLEPGRELDFTHFWGGRASAKRGFLLEHGAFNQDFTFGYEDIELGFRLSSHGFAVVYSQQALSYMMRELTFEDLCLRCQSQGRSLRRLAAIHPNPTILNYCGLDRLRELWREAESSLVGTCARARMRLTSIESCTDDLELGGHLDELHNLLDWIFPACTARGAFEHHVVAVPSSDSVEEPVS